MTDVRSYLSRVKGTEEEFPLGKFCVLNAIISEGEGTSVYTRKRALLDELYG